MFPLKWIAQGMRSVFLPDSFATQEVGGWQLPQAALVLAAWTVVGLLLCAADLPLDPARRRLITTPDLSR